MRLTLIQEPALKLLPESILLAQFPQFLHLYLQCCNPGCEASIFIV
jgi:hypothetical protein